LLLSPGYMWADFGMQGIGCRMCTVITVSVPENPAALYWAPI
jgi:hypothetical protein